MIKSKGRIRARMAVSVAVGALALAARADAQTASKDTELGQVIVTAQKRSENLQETPVAVTALTGDRIEQTGVAGPQQLQFLAPSLNFGNVGAFSFVSLRGVGTNATSSAAESSVATYVDGVYIGNVVGEGAPSFDLQRIEVLRGPQGTLYGRNSAGGVISYLTKAPSFEPGAALSLSYGAYDAIRANAAVTGPISGDTIAGRLSIHYDEHDGYRFNLFSGRHEDDARTISARGTILARPTDNLTVTLRGDILNTRSSPPSLLFSLNSLDGFTSETTPLGIFSLPAATLAAMPGILSPADLAKLNGGSIARYFGLIQPGPVAPSPTESRTFSNAVPTRHQVEARGGSMTLDWDAGPATVKSITAYRWTKYDGRFDPGAIGTPQVYFGPIIETHKQFTQEFNVSGKAFDSRLEWLFGAFYYRDDSSSASNIWVPTLGQQTILQVGLANPAGSPFRYSLDRPINLQLYAGPGLLKTALLNAPEFRTGLPLVAGVTVPTEAMLAFDDDQISESLAAFAQATYRVTDRLRLTAGARYTGDRKRVERSYHSNILATLGATSNLCDSLSQKKSWSAPTGTIGADYDVADDILTYAKVSWGYKAGGGNNVECRGFFKPEKLTSYEVGFKSLLADRQVLLNVAAYYYDYKDIQFNTFIPNGSIISNAGSATALGAEVEYFLRPEFLRGFQLDGSVSFEASDYGAGCFNDPARLAGPVPGLDAGGNAPKVCPAGVADYAQIKGNDLVRAPRWKAAFGAQYAVDAANGDNWLARFDAAYSDTVYQDVFNGQAKFQAATAQPSYWLLSARVAWASPDRRYGVEAFADNITNTYYATNRSAANTPSSVVRVGGNLGPPRTYGVRLTMKLGSEAH